MKEPRPRRRNQSDSWQRGCLRVCPWLSPSSQQPRHSWSRGHRHGQQGTLPLGPGPCFSDRSKLGPVLSFRDPCKGSFPQGLAMEGGSLHAPLEPLRPVIQQGTSNIEGGDVLRGQGWTNEAGSAGRGRGRLVLPGLVDAPSDRRCRTQEVQIRIGPGCLRAWPWGGVCLCVCVWGGGGGQAWFLSSFPKLTVSVLAS